MSVKKDTKLALKNQEHITRTVIGEQLVQMLGTYKTIGDAENFEKAIKKASKIISKIVVVPTPAAKTPKPKPKTAKKAPAKKS